MRIANRTIGAMLCLWLLELAPVALADGMVFTPEARAKVEIPNQQAMIHFADGVEDLVVETTFLAAGTNFAWVVPLPGVPEIKPVSESFFPDLQQTFQPRLIHEVRPYYAGVLFLCGLALLAWRALKDEVSWTRDLPLCLLLAGGVWFLGKFWLFGALMFCFALYVRIMARSTANIAVVMLIGLVVSLGITFLPNSHGFGLIATMGIEAAEQADPGVEIVSVQRAGIFETTVIRGSSPRAVMEWLKQNGYEAPDSIELAVQRYVQEGWVFAASKARRDSAAAVATALRPLAFRFAARKPVYPMRLTAAGNSDCVIDLYVFGDQRARARHFHAVRWDRVAQAVPPSPETRWKSRLKIADGEIARCIGGSSVGTKLSGKLSPNQMDADVEIKWGGFGLRGAWVCSAPGAARIALNVAAPLAALSWLLVGTCRGSWNVNEKFVWRWRWGLLLGAVAAGVIIYLLLPKVEIVTIPPMGMGG